MLDSPGGSLLEGIELGRVIRDHGLFTYINKAGRDKHEDLPGGCYSACTLAFLGGQFRFIDKESKFGVHRFYSVGTTESDSDVSQILSAAIVQYIRDMGVDPDLFTEMTRAGKSEINILEHSKLSVLKVVNNGEGETTWNIESLPTNPPTLYLKGQRDTIRGINKFIAICTPEDGLIVYFIFDPEGRSQEILSMSAQSLFIDSQPIPIAERRIKGPTEENGWINVAYSLSQELTKRLLKAKTTGIAFQYSYEAPLFLGFDGLDFTMAKEKFSGLIATCK